MKDLNQTLTNLAEKLAERLNDKEVKLPTMIDGFKALSAHYIATSKPAKKPPADQKTPTTEEDFGSMQARIAAAENQTEGKPN